MKLKKRVIKRTNLNPEYDKSVDDGGFDKPVVRAPALLTLSDFSLP